MILLFQISLLIFLVQISWMLHIIHFELLTTIHFLEFHNSQKPNYLYFIKRLCAYRNYEIQIESSKNASLSSFISKFKIVTKKSMVPVRRQMPSLVVASCDAFKSMISKV